MWNPTTATAGIWLELLVVVQELIPALPTITSVYTSIKRGRCGNNS
jgi:hypothetical protein